MKKRLLIMLLLLCLLLTALTATAGAEYTGAGGLLDCTLDGRTFHFSINGRYRCESNHTTGVLYAEDHKLLSVEAKKSDGTVVPIAEWRPGDKILAKVEIPNFNCSRCIEDGGLCGSMNKTINATIEFTGDDFCHRWRNSNNPLTTRMDHIRGADTNDYIDFNLYCYYTSLYQLRHHDAGKPTCEEDGYDAEWYRCPLCSRTFSDDRGANEITVNPRLGHDFDANGICQRCSRQAEAYIYNPTTQSKSYRATATEAIADASTGEAVIVVSYAADKTDPIVLNKAVDLTVNTGVTVPEIRLEALSGQNTGAYTNINNYGNVKLLSSATAAQQLYPSIFISNHGSINEITVSSAIAQDLTISNTIDGTIGEINIPQTANTTPKVQVTNNGGKIDTLSGSPKNVTLCTGTGSYGTIQNRVGSADSLLNTGCYFYFPNDGQKWANKCAESKVSGVIVSEAPFTVTVNRNTTALALSEDGSYTVDGVNVNDTVALSAAFALNEYGLKVNESEITSRWYYKGESKNVSENNTLTLKDIQYGVYDLFFEAKESTYGFTTSVNVKVNVNLPAEKTAISLKNQLTSDSYTKVYDGTTNTKGILPPIEFQLADEREIRISPDYYTATAEYKSPNCIDDNKIIVTVTLNEEGQKYYTLTNGEIKVDATITPYDGEWYDGVQHYKAFFVGLSDAGYDGSASIGRNVLPYLQLKGNMYDAVKKELSLRNITPEDGFQYSFYHLRPGAKEPDPELDELLTADSVFTYPEDKYHFYAVVKPSLNYAECITDTSYFKVRDTYSGAHTHDSKTYAAWDGSSLSIATGGTATRYLSGAQANVNVELALSQKKTLDLCLYNKAVHVIGSSHDQIYLVGGSTLVLSDCRKTGKIIGSAVASGSGGVAYVKNGTLSVYDVTLTGGIAKNGGAIVVDKDGTLNLYSGEISGNYVTGGSGGAIYVKSGGVVNMYGGTIRNNHAYSGNGGAIYVEAGGTLNLFGGEISGNTASGNGGGIYVEAGGMVNVKGAPIVKDNTANGKPSNLYICANSSSPLLTIDAEGLTTDAQIGISTDASCPMLLARGMQTDYSAYFIPDDANTFVLYNSDAKTLTLCAKPTATLEGDTLTITTGSGNMSNTFVLLAAEYDTGGKMLAVQSWNVAPQEDTYACGVKNPGAKIKCFLLRATSYTPVLTPFSPLA